MKPKDLPRLGTKMRKVGSKREPRRELDKAEPKRGRLQGRAPGRDHLQEEKQNMMAFNLFELSLT